MVLTISFWFTPERDQTVEFFATPKQQNAQRESQISHMNLYIFCSPKQNFIEFV